MNELIDYAVGMGWLQWLALVFNLLYVVFAARENILCWVFGFIGVSLLFFIYVDTRLYSDATLQVFYMAMSVYGWLSWRENTPEDRVPIQSMRLRQHIIYMLVGLAGTVALGLFWKQFGAALPYVDALTTSFSIIATFLVARKWLENWLYWIIIDAVCAVVYMIRDIPLIAFLFVVYVILAVYGYVKWLKKYRTVA